MQEFHIRGAVDDSFNFLLRINPFLVLKEHITSLISSLQNLTHRAEKEFAQESKYGDIEKY